MSLNYKEIIEKDKRELRLVKTLISNEIEKRNQLDKYLRACVDDVKNEIAKKKVEISKLRSRKSSIFEFKFVF
jgi:hypothetical protein